MRIYAGIDEAGYGPMFGPFVVARTVFAVEEEDPQGPPRLWETLSSAVCKSVKDRKRRIAVNDSKKLFSPDTGVAQLERGVLAFLRSHELRPAKLDELLTHVAMDDQSRLSQLLWYHDPEGGPALPSSWHDDQIGIAGSQLGRCLSQSGVKLGETRAAVIYEDRFNQIIDTTRSKAACAWQFVAGHLWEVWERYGEHHPWVAVDRQGGRKVYHPQLQLLFQGAQLRLLDESEDVSRYHLQLGPRQMTVSFETGSEDRHLPTALASMLAKYLREMLMVRFNRFWQAHVPQLKRTAGYVQDGRRFLAQIEQHLDRLNIDRGQLIRSR